MGLAVHPTAPLVVTACLDGGVRAWDVRSGALTNLWTGHTAGVQCVALTCDGKYVVSGSDDHTVRVFEFKTGGGATGAGPAGGAV